jgi:hypothetical protein
MVPILIAALWVAVFCMIRNCVEFDLAAGRRDFFILKPFGDADEPSTIPGASIEGIEQDLNLLTRLLTAVRDNASKRRYFTAGENS